MYMSTLVSPVLYGFGHKYVLIFFNIERRVDLNPNRKFTNRHQKRKK